MKPKPNVTSAATNVSSAPSTPAVTVRTDFMGAFGGTTKNAITASSSSTMSFITPLDANQPSLRSVPPADISGRPQTSAVQPQNSELKLSQDDSLSKLFDDQKHTS